MSQTQKSNKRKSLSKTVRFEVFKRDSFTCQYCGSKAPEVVLHVDHIVAVATGGGNELLNLITSCGSCNSGKSAKPLGDHSAVEKQRKMLEELQQRREQLEMLLAWRDGLSQLKEDTLSAVCDRFNSHSHMFVNPRGRATLKKLIAKFTVSNVLDSIDEACDIYIEYEDGAPTEESVQRAFSKVGTFCSIRKQEVDNPDIKKIFISRV